MTLLGMTPHQQTAHARKWAKNHFIQNVIPMVLVVAARAGERAVRAEFATILRVLTLKSSQSHLPLAIKSSQ